MSVSDCFIIALTEFCKWFGFYKALFFPASKFNLPKKPASTFDFELELERGAKGSKPGGITLEDRPRKFVKRRRFGGKPETLVGLVVTALPSDSAAFKTGLRPRDVLINIDG